MMMHGSLDQSISPYESHLRNPKLFYQNQLISNIPADVLWVSRFSSSTGLVQPPPPFVSQSRQPPLLPLPTTPMRLARGLSCPPPNKNISNSNRTRFTPKKSKSPEKQAKSSTCGRICKNDSSLAGNQVISPPPSSLPVPTFSLRPKHGCKAEEPTGINSGATDDLRRLLRLR